MGPLSHAAALQSSRALFLASAIAKATRRRSAVMRHPFLLIVTGGGEGRRRRTEAGGRRLSLSHRGRANEQEEDGDHGKCARLSGCEVEQGLLLPARTPCHASSVSAIPPERPPRPRTEIAAFLTFGQRLSGSLRKDWTDGQTLLGRILFEVVRISLHVSDNFPFCQSSCSLVHAPKITGVPLALVTLCRCGEIEGNRAVWKVYRARIHRGIWPLHRKSFAPSAASPSLQPF